MPPRRPPADSRPPSKRATPWPAPSSPASCPRPGRGTPTVSATSSATPARRASPGRRCRDSAASAAVRPPPRGDNGELHVTEAYAYTPYVWPMLAPVALLVPLAVHAWRHRSAPGARPFVLLVACVVPWAVGAALEVAAVAPETKLGWFVFKSLWKLPTGTASLLFAVEYADLGRWLGRRALALLAIPPAIPFVLVLAAASRGSLHDVEVVLASRAPFVLGPVGLVLTGYGVVVALAASAVFLWLLVKSPLHRWPAALCLLGHVATRAGFAADVAGAGLAGPMDATILGSTFTAVLYAAALVPFRMFELVPVARGSLLEQMPDGVLVLDARGRVVDLNPAAERLLGVAASRVRGHEAPEPLAALPLPGAAGPPEVSLGTAGEPRLCVVRRSPLRHRGGFPLGELVVLQDVTERRRAEARAIDRERALATLHERDLVARELHDGLGQVLGFAKLQARAARELLARGDAAQADAHLARLEAVAQDAHADVREFLLGARAGGAPSTGFLPALEDYLRRYGAASGLATSLEASPSFAAADLEPMAGTQLLRILQESLTNVRKHARARSVRVGLSVLEGRVAAVVEDDGDGFDPGREGASEEGTFGLRFMRERAGEVGGTVRVDSVPGAGTRVAITVPLERRPS
ncbi:PAS domain-containing protein [Acidobacteria bacterium ACD]|nr:PAS domain-containing protein [Acidobacteria bacterium ACD]